MRVVPFEEAVDSLRHASEFSLHVCRLFQVVAVPDIDGVDYAVAQRGVGSAHAALR